MARKKQAPITKTVPMHDYTPPLGWKLTTLAEWEDYRQLQLDRINRLGSEANLSTPSIPAQRQPVYGHPALNFARQALVWTGLLANKLTQPITSQEVALLMAACKLARLVESPTHEDSINDVGGYMSCLEQVNAVVACGTDGSGIRSETVAQDKARTVPLATL